MKQGKHRVAVR